MRHIHKQGDGGYDLDQAHQHPPETAEQASSRWRSFNGKQQVLECLLAEQYHLCCYTELRADQYDLGYHIEHVENKSQAPQRTFDYSNLAASALASHAINELKERQELDNLPQDQFGGHASGKQKSVDMLRFISPHQTDCRHFFAYLSDGRVVPTEGLSQPDKQRAIYTIDLLNLNSPFLQVERRKWWDELDLLMDEHLRKDMDLHCLAAVDLVPSANKLNPFFSITRHFFGRIAEKVLNQSAPQLL